MDEMIILTEKLLLKGCTGKCGINHLQLELFNELPSRGWKKRLIGREIPLETYEKFVSLKGATTYKRMRKDPGVRFMRPSEVGRNRKKFKQIYLTPDNTVGISKNNNKVIRKIKDSKNFDRGKIKSYIRKMGYKEFLRTPYWKAISKYMKENNDYRCILCGSSLNLNVHHTTYRNHGDEINHLADLMVVCRNCHKEIHGLEGK